MFELSGHPIERGSLAGKRRYLDGKPETKKGGKYHGMWKYDTTEKTG
jgi:hypothetical protein